MSALDGYLAGVEAMVKARKNVWRDEGSEHLARLYIEALAEGTHSMHEINEMVHATYKRHGLVVTHKGVQRRRE